MTLVDVSPKPFSMLVDAWYSNNNRIASVLAQVYIQVKACYTKQLHLFASAPLYNNKCDVFHLFGFHFIFSHNVKFTVLAIENKNCKVICTMININDDNKNILARR